jgi:diguanylate cyclase (GGDEF)-like protein
MKEVTELLALTHEYAMYAEGRAAQQWKQHHGQMLAGLSVAVAGRPVDALEHAKSLGDLFLRLEDVGKGADGELKVRRQQLLLGQLLTNVRNLSDSVMGWSDLLVAEQQRDEQRFHVVALSTPVLLLIILLMLAFMLRQRVLRPLSNLQTQVTAVAQGKAILHSASQAKDELGDLSRNFDAMAVKLVSELRTEIVERKHAEEQIRHLAYYEPLTNLPNRRLLYDRLNQAMASSKRNGRHCALIFLDLDNFKSLNDVYGHGAGDLLLVEIAHRLTKSVRGVDTVARVGGDEFVVVLSELLADRDQSVSLVAVLAEKILATLCTPFLTTLDQEGHADITVEHHGGASMGVVLFRGDELNQEQILKAADHAMYRAKDAGGNHVVFAEVAD